MTTGERQQEQSAGRAIGDHRGIFHVEQFQAVEQQPGQRGGRSVCSRGQRPGMRSQREVDRDAAVAVLERDDDVTPQIMIREPPAKKTSAAPGRTIARPGARAGFPVFRIPWV